MIRFPYLSGWLGIVLVSVVVTGPLSAKAQVIEIGSDGGVRTYDGPAAIRADGTVTPLRPARPELVRLTPIEAVDTGALRIEAAAAASLSPALVEAVAWRESHFHHWVVSPAGAVGEMQLMPGTARALGVDPFDSAQNYRGGATYLKALMQRFDGDLVLTLAAYNAGPGAVEKYRGVPPFKETRDYINAVLDRLSQDALVADSHNVGK